MDIGALIGILESKKKLPLTPTSKQQAAITGSCATNLLNESIIAISLSLSLSHSLLVSLRSSFYLRRNGSASFQFCKKNDTVFTIRVGLYSRSQIAGFTAQLAPKPLIYFIYNLYLYFFIPLLIFKCYVIEFFFFVLWKGFRLLLFPKFSNCFVKLVKKLAKKKRKIPRLKK